MRTGTFTDFRKSQKTTAKVVLKGRYYWWKLDLSAENRLFLEDVNSKRVGEVTAVPDGKTGEISYVGKMLLADTPEEMPRETLRYAMNSVEMRLEEYYVSNPGLDSFREDALKALSERDTDAPEIGWPFGSNKDWNDFFKESDLFPKIWKNEKPWNPWEGQKFYCHTVVETPVFVGGGGGDPRGGGRGGSGRDVNGNI